MLVTFEFHLRCHYETSKALILTQILEMREHIQDLLAQCTLVKLAGHSL